MCFPMLSLEGRKSPKECGPGILLPSGQGATLREASARIVIQEVLELLF